MARANVYKPHYAYFTSRYGTNHICKENNTTVPVSWAKCLVRPILQLCLEQPILQRRTPAVSLHSWVTSASATSRPTARTAPLPRLPSPRSPLLHLECAGVPLPHFADARDIRNRKRPFLLPSSGAGGPRRPPPPLLPSSISVASATCLGRASAEKEQVLGMQSVTRELARCCKVSSKGADAELDCYSCSGVLRG
ncbi:hypothetical protein ZEAMMB73_Zm00001d015833 [Zea mays]|uniref:Uncharacterized protein n=1 Tax=Zea mays TaxID=4577 RepID=A0A1D6H480_MAIZE|nr:hypothetical protein ZEAMMB73_Zm00001d015833 [Zea mays]